jgi:hypothetical protein
MARRKRHAVGLVINERDGHKRLNPFNTWRLYKKMRGESTFQKTEKLTRIAIFQKFNAPETGKHEQNQQSPRMRSSATHTRLSGR